MIGYFFCSCSDCCLVGLRSGERQKVPVLASNAYCLFRKKCLTIFLSFFHCMHSSLTLGASSAPYVHCAFFTFAMHLFSFRLSRHKDPCAMECYLSRQI